MHSCDSDYVDGTGNSDLARRAMGPIENTIREPSRYTQFHHGQGELLDHMLTRNMLALPRLRDPQRDAARRISREPPAGN